MASRVVSIKSLGDVVEKIYSNDEAVEDSLYALYQDCYKMSKTKHFRGTNATKVKRYLEDGPINCITGLMDVSNSIRTVVSILVGGFCEYESSNRGVISDDILVYIRGKLNGHLSSMLNQSNDVNSILSKASKYINVTPLDLSTAERAFKQSKNKTDEIEKTITEMDLFATKQLEKTLEQCKGINTQIANVASHCYSGEHFNYANATSLQNQSWYERSPNVALLVKLSEDPFAYDSKNAAVSEDQWAVGLCKDIYAYGGYQFVSGDYEYGIEGGKHFAKAAGSLLTVSAYLQITDYVRAQGEAKVLYGEGEVSAGFSDGYYGFSAEGEVGVFKADGSVTIGTDDINAFIKGEVKVLTAEGKVACSYEEGGELKFGVKAEATFASAKGKAGFSLFKVKKDTSNSKYIPEDAGLFEVYVAPKANGGGSVDAWLETETVIEGEYININTAEIDLGLSALVGGELSVKVPYFHVNIGKLMPWNW